MTYFVYALYAFICVTPLIYVVLMMWKEKNDRRGRFEEWDRKIKEYLEGRNNK